MKRYIAYLSILICSVSYAEELPSDFDALPWNEKTASKWVEQIPPKYEEVYLTEYPTDKSFRVYGVEEKTTEADTTIYKVFIDTKEKESVTKDASYAVKPVLKEITAEVIDLKGIR